MDAIGAQEMLLPALNPAELWQESGRWDVMGDNMFRLKDRFGRDLCLGMTHEEVMTTIARGELRSYKQLPQIWYQIQTKFRDEPRPKSGLLRVRQFIMKDSYSFDMDAGRAGRLVREALRRVLPDLRPLRAGRIWRWRRIRARWAAASRTEFMVASEAGEDFVVVCPNCGYAANLEKAVSRSQPLRRGRSGRRRWRRKSFTRPGRKTIAEVAEFTGLPETSQMKSLVMVADGKPVLALLRGDHQLSETKFASAMRAQRDSRRRIRRRFGSGSARTPGRWVRWA